MEKIDKNDKFYLEKIDTNEGDISSNLKKINTNEGNISSSLDKIDNINDFLTPSINFKKTYNIENNYLDLIKIHIFTQFLKKKLIMILLKIVYYL